MSQDKCYKILKDNPGRQFKINEIAKMIGKPKPNTSRFLLKVYRNKQFYPNIKKEYRNKSIRKPARFREIYAHGNICLYSYGEEKKNEKERKVEKVHY